MDDPGWSKTQMSNETDTPETDALIDSFYDERWYMEYARLARHAKKLERERNKARRVAENLVEYAHKCLCELELWAKCDERFEEEIKTIRGVIADCEKLKEETK